MARLPSPAEGPFAEEKDHGLRFTNDEWNGSIANGEPFTLKWNRSVDESGAVLELYEVVYPEDGLVVHEPILNLTDSMSSSSCVWTPTGLPDGLYTLWLTTKGDIDPGWTISPPWRPKLPPKHGVHWAAPVGIPIVVLLGLYGVGLLVCILHRRRKKAREAREAAKAEVQALDPNGAGRHPSFSSVVTVQTMELENEGKKEGVWLFSNSSRTSSMVSSEQPIGVTDCYCSKIREPELARLDSRETRRSSIA